MFHDDISITAGMVSMPMYGRGLDINRSIGSSARAPQITNC
jgi:hypothetical protein